MDFSLRRKSLDHTPQWSRFFLGCVWESYVVLGIVPGSVICKKAPVNLCTVPSASLLYIYWVGLMGRKIVQGLSTCKICSGTGRPRFDPQLRMVL